MKRLFIATHISPSKNLRNFFWDIQNKFLKEKIKWVGIDSLHLTLKFLGDTPEQKIPLINEVLQKIISDEYEFDITLEGVGVFPDYRRPRVLWCGIANNNEKLKKIASSVDKKLQVLGFEPEKRPFKAHLTLGRIKFMKEIGKLREFLAENNNVFIQKQKIKNVTLFESILRPQGPVYNVVEQFNLKTKNNE